MSELLLSQLISALTGGHIRIVDLTQTLSPDFPQIVLPPEMGQAWPFRIEEASRYDARGPGWYWNNFSCSEHTGTHFDAPIHWISGRHLPDNSTDTISAKNFIAPACVLDCTRESAANADFLLTVDFLKTWERRHGRIPAGSWVLMRTDWSKRTDPVAYQNIDETGQHTPGPDSDAVQFLVDQRQVLGFGSEAIGTDAGQAFHLKPPYPCHYYMHGSGRLGLQCLTNLDLLPPTGAVVIAAPLKIKEGSGSPLRVLALVPEPSHVRKPGKENRANQTRSKRPVGRAKKKTPMILAGILSAFPPGERTVPAMLQQQAQRYGDRPLFAAGDATWSFAQAPAIAARFAGTLAAAGIRPGDRVALMCGNRAEFMEAFLGCAWAGAIAVPLNIAARGPQLSHYLRNSGARLLIIEADLVDALTYIDTQDLALEAIWRIGDTTQAPPIGRAAITDVPARAEAIAPCAANPAQTLAILYTSGTTGPSKGVCCPHAQYFWWGFHGIRNLQIRDGDVLSTTLPLFHTNALGTFHQALLSGSTLVAEPRFSASRFWQRLIERRATVTYLLGAMVPILLSKEPSPDEQAHTVRCALAPGVPANLHRTFEQRTGVHLLDGYGSTETNFVIGGTAAERRPGRMGTAREGFDARVVAASGGDALPGQPGELLLRTDEPLAFAGGYFAMPEKTAEAFRDGWFHTGDRVVREADGYFRFVDRMKDAIRRRGENISSFEVEQVLLSHPDVGNAAVFPVASELAEDEVMAAVVRRAGSALTERALAEFCAPRLARFAVPRFIEFVDALPTTENGKVQKYKLRDRGVTPKAWDREAEAAPIRR